MARSPSTRTGRSLPLAAQAHPALFRRVLYVGSHLPEDVQNPGFSLGIGEDTVHDDVAFDHGRRAKDRRSGRPIARNTVHSAPVRLGTRDAKGQQIVGCLHLDADAGQHVEGLFDGGTRAQRVAHLDFGDALQQGCQKQEAA